VPAFAKAGVKTIVLVATDAAKLKTIEAGVKAINPSVQALSVSADISDPASVDNLFAEIKSRLPDAHASILVNSAGVVQDGEGAQVADADAATWWRGFEINTRGAFLIARGFLRQLPGPDAPATVVQLTTGAAWTVFPHLSGYSLSKLAAQQLMQYVAGGYPHVTAVAVHPGLVDTDMLLDQFRNFDQQSPELLGGLAVWLSHPHAKFLSGATVASWWDVDDMVARREDIVSGGLLKMNMKGDFSAEQFK
jgi:NAD(P)-dependent dehydrogenase (short-subunit alcohol dehydrogenase family)